MSPRLRVGLIVAIVAVAAAAVTVGATLLAAEPTDHAAPVRPRAGAPPLALDLGVRADAEARALVRAAALYRRGRRADAGRIFARYRSVPAEVGAALAAWPDGTLGRLESLARERPRSALVRLHLGLVRLWLRDDAGAVAAWGAAERVEPDSSSALRAEDLLYPNFPRGRPLFVPSFDVPPGLARLSAAGQVAALARAARGGGVHARLLYGVALQRLGRPVSAEREFAAATAAAPHDPEALVAAAVGRFDKADPSRAFSRLGPLARRFPRSPTVRFHLGLMLLWLGQVDQAKRELRLARAVAPRSALGREANAFLVRLETVRTR